MLKVKSISKDYGKFKLEDVSFHLPPGYIMGLIGPNGAGKTTTLSIILNFISKGAGDVSILGTDHIAGEAEVKKQIGVVFDSNVFVCDWKVMEAGRAMAIFYDNWKQKTFLEMLSLFGLDGNKKVGQLSKGMQTKLMLACAFAHDARLLILDEPTSGMDPPSRDELLELLQDYIKDGNRSVLFSTHITADLERVADYITYIRGGRVFFTGPTEELIEEYRIIKGGREDLTGDLRGKIHGLRMHTTGFEGLVSRRDVSREPAGCILERGTIDEIMIYTAREDEHK
ncbi:MAG: ABC transporter ATP-binding protein [Oscillospiraceae bacterium]|jgi:ABC-2 type transport system ATP-binding protein|nr:ABC transporter ATP-binding protein [Oscillospiraceae bacterium]